MAPCPPVRRRGAAGDRRRTAAVAALGALLLAAAYAVHATVDLAVANRRYVALTVAMVVLAGACAALLWRRSRGRDVAVVLAVALLARLLIAFDAPTLSDDAYRFVWDGRVQAAGINPYSHAPADLALRHLRDYAVFTEVNRAFTPTLYPPTNQIAFLAVNRLAGEGVVRLKLAWVALEALVVALLLMVLGRTGRCAGRVALYAWHPLAVVEIAGSGHPEPLLLAPTLTALLLWATGRRARAGVALAVAALARFVPILLGPFMLRRGGLRLAAGFAVAAAALYAPYLGAGAAALGSVGRYGAEEFGSGPYRWLTQAGLGATPARALLLAGLAAAVAYGAARPPRDLAAACRTSALLFAAAILASAQVQPWYLLWVLPFLAVTPVAGLLWASASVSAFYLSFGPSNVASQDVVALVVWGPTVALLGLELLRRPRERPQPVEVPSGSGCGTGAG